MILHLYDFDGTLFKSPLPPKGYEGYWWRYAISLSPPCVPEQPTKDYWIIKTTSSAKKSIGDPNIYAILCTGRANKPKIFQRITTLLKQRGLNFNEVFLNHQEDVPSYKMATIANLHKKHRFSEVHIWEDNLKDLKRFVSFVQKELDIPCIPHPVKEKAMPPLCNAETVKQWIMKNAVASRWLSM